MVVVRGGQRPGWSIVQPRWLRVGRGRPARLSRQDPFSEEFGPGGCDSPVDLATEESGRKAAIEGAEMGPADGAAELRHRNPHKRWRLPPGTMQCLERGGHPVGA